MAKNKQQSHNLGTPVVIQSYTKIIWLIGMYLYINSYLIIIYVCVCVCMRVCTCLCACICACILVNSA